MSEINEIIDDLPAGTSSAPKVSVVVPVYKVEKYLPECIESILAQTFTDFELILVDDGSPDKSGKICDDYAARDSRIRVFHKENGGVTSARRLGVENAKGEWIMFVDSDDCLFPKALEVLVAEIRDDVDLIEGSCTRFRSHGDCPTGPGRQNFLCEISGLEYAIEVASHKMVWIPGPVAKIIRKSVLISANALDVPAWINHGEDLMMNLKVSCNIGTALKVPECIYYYRDNLQSVSRNNVRTVSYYCRFLETLESFIPQGVKGPMRQAWIYIAQHYFVRMFLLGFGEDSDADAYISKILRELRREIFSLPFKIRVCLMIMFIRPVWMRRMLQSLCIFIFHVRHSPLKIFK